MSIFFKHLPTIVAVLGFIITINILLKKGDNGYYSSVRKFEDDELDANSTTKNITKLELNYITPNISSLPIKEYNDNRDKLVLLQDKVLKKTKLDMIKLPINTTNTELKKMYGVNNFKHVSKLEEHYNSYVRSLYDWANELFSQEEFDDCEKILLEACRIEGNISSIYILLASIYAKNNDRSSLLALKEKVSNYNLSLKEKIIKNIESNIR